MYFTFIFKVKAPNGVHLYYQTWLSRKQWHIGQSCYCQDIESRIWTFDWHIYIWSWLILKAMHLRSCRFRLLISHKRWWIGQTLILPTNRKSYKISPLHIYIWHWPILKVKVKVVHVTIANFSQMVTNGANMLRITNLKSHTAKSRLLGVHFRKDSIRWQMSESAKESHIFFALILTVSEIWQF